MALPFITIVLDKPRNLRLSMKTILEFEAANNVKLLDIVTGLTFDMATKLLHTMLKKEDATLTLDDTIALIDEYIVPGEAVDLVVGAIEAAFPGKKPPDEGEVPNESPAELTS